MPLATDPQQTFEVVLGSDEAKPAESRPTFIFHYLTRRESRQVREAWEGLDEARDADGNVDAAVEAVIECVRGNLVGWEHQVDRQGKPVPFDPARLEDLVGDMELMELFVRMRAGNDMLPADLKKSGSPSPSDSGSSDEDAAGGPAEPA